MIDGEGNEYICFQEETTFKVWPGSPVYINKKLAEEAYKEYLHHGGRGQSFERLHERGGFGLSELLILLYARIKRLEGEPVSVFDIGSPFLKNNKTF